MNLTIKLKEYIDSLSYSELLKRWRFATIGDNWFTGETGVYWARRMAELKAEDPKGAVTASKTIGWEKPL